MTVDRESGRSMAATGSRPIRPVLWARETGRIPTYTPRGRKVARGWEITVAGFPGVTETVTRKDQGNKAAWKLVERTTGKPRTRFHVSDVQFDIV
jgi:hypothetical protein